MTKMELMENPVKLAQYATLFFVAFILLGPPVYAEESFGKIFLTPKQRAVIEQERNAYLQRQQVTSQDEATKKTAEKKAKSTRLAPNLTLSSIITTPEGQSFRLNGQYVKHAKAGYKVQQGKMNPSVAKVSLQGKVVHLKVGETYVPTKGKVEKSYLIPSKKQKEKLKLNVNTTIPSSPIAQDEKKLDMTAELNVLQRLTQAAK